VARTWLSLVERQRALPTKVPLAEVAEMAKLLGLPVVLVVDAAAMARSAAAVIHGFVTFDPAVRFAGVILNNVGGAAHVGMIRDAVGDTIPIFGALPRAADLVIPERHLGLHLPHEGRRDYVGKVANLIEEHVDVDQLLSVTSIPRRPALMETSPPEPRARIGIARDEAFCFYYADNLELLAQAGAELVEFSPIRDPMPSDLDGIYIGGGYPGLHAKELAENTVTKTAIREFAASGGPIYAECGGLMYLARQLRVADEVYPQCGVLPFSTTMPAPLKLAYVEVETTGGLFGAGKSARGHLFHRSEISDQQTGSSCYHLRTSRGDQGEEGYTYRNVLASYIHLHFASDPTLAGALVKRCEEYRASQHPA
jgi:cobyrinic acid a,c-diamide synthase